jgi:uncharacterized protein (DUF1499 family)
MTALAILALLLVAIALGYMLLEKRVGYGAWYGLARLSGAPLDIGPVNWAALTRRATSNDALVCPPERCPNAKLDREAKTYAMPPADLLARLEEIALAETNTRALPCEREHTARVIQYTRLMRFPDTIDVEAFAAPGDRSTLAIYSRSLLGREDFGVNRARIARWLAKLDAGSGHNPA